jgi:hypothetical protein
MPFKRNWVKTKTASPDQKKGLYQDLKNEITKVREQGAPPNRDPSTFSSRYQCDLCNVTFPIKDLRQCVLCGRWACKDCWTPDLYVCNSCQGIIRLYRMKGSD